MPPLILSNEPFEPWTTAALADNTANPTVPGVAAYNMVYDSAGGNWDREAAISLVDSDTGAGTALTVGVLLGQKASGGWTESFISTNPGFVSLRNTATFADSVTGSDWGPTYGFPYIYNGLSGTWYRQQQAQLTYSGAGLSQLGVPVHVMAGYYTSGALDTPANNSFHIPQITLNRALHINPRNASGTEIFTTTTPGVVDANVANDAVDAGNPHKIGGKANNSRPTAVSADADRVDAWFDRNGRQVTKHDFFTRSDTYTGTANGTTIDCSLNPCQYFSLQVKGTGGAATTWDVRIEGSLDGTNFDQNAASIMVNNTQADGDGAIKYGFDKPVLYFRSRCAGLVLGAATNIVATILGRP